MVFLSSAYIKGSKDNKNSDHHGNRSLKELNDVPKMFKEKKGECMLKFEMDSAQKYGHVNVSLASVKKDRAISQKLWKPVSPSFGHPRHWQSLARVPIATFGTASSLKSSIIIHRPCSNDSNVPFSLRCCRTHRRCRTCRTCRMCCAAALLRCCWASPSATHWAPLLHLRILLVQPIGPDRSWAVLRHGPSCATDLHNSHSGPLK